jgi:hypothetical protein
MLCKLRLIQSNKPKDALRIYSLHSSSSIVIQPQRKPYLPCPLFHFATTPYTQRNMREPHQAFVTNANYHPNNH